MVFEVSAEKIRTFKDFTRTTSDRWASHEIIGDKPKLEFLGPGLDMINFTMRFDVNLGMNPRVEMERLLEMSRSGRAEDLTIGGKSLGVGLWSIKNLVQKWTTVDSMGRVLVGEVEITLEEYT
ncbi:phage tail protein [Paenibacillus ehimensis]|uniref:phage tail protein n=1 Tax=Paenibacillus ehimensis TaxID=79264 RepID=UPI00047135D1|nr:phage tail protein [Paenibacillus ehimensis]